ncbi:MAG: response regulator transcription factor [Acidobacteriota bacterium]|nr:response regulator transcription factor [Acidobacteriota bacterium]
MPEKVARILLVDDHQLVAFALRKLLETRHEVVDIATSGRQMLELAPVLRPDIILTDIAMPGLDGLEATRRLSSGRIHIPVIILTMHDEPEQVRAAFEAGASGYLVKGSDPRELFEAIATVLAGGRFLSSAVGGDVIGSFLFPGAKPPGSSLTDRETEVAALVGAGLDNSEISRQLCIAEVTVRSHCLKIGSKLGLRNRVEIARHALSQGWASL